MADPRPRVLMLTPWPPYPLNGGCKRVHTLCRLLKDRFRFSLLSFRPRLRGPTAAALDMRRELEHILPVFEEVRWVEPSAGPAPARANGLDLPGDVAPYWSGELDRALRELAAARAFDLLHVEFDLMAAYARSAPGVPRVLTQHDMGGSTLFGSYFREMAGWGKFARLGRWWRRARYVRRTAADFDRIVLVTEGDRAAQERVAPRGRVRVVPTGVDLGHFAPAEPRGEGGARLVFVGHYPHFPNEDAVVWFCREVFPLIRRSRPDATLEIVGSEPTLPVLRASEQTPGTSVTGTVPDVRPHLAAADVFVAPVRLGRGIKGKILEAFAMGLPVVATRRAASGIEAVPGRDLLTADRPAAFADETLSLLASPERRRELGRRGREAARRYDWPALAEGLAETYRELYNPVSPRP